MQQRRLSSSVYWISVMALAGFIGGSTATSAIVSPKADAAVDNVVAPVTVLPETVPPETVLAEAVPLYRQVGVASWYGGRHQGRLTASGEVFDENKLTAAHRTLPLVTWARVTNLENGRSVEVRVNDRGPYIDGRVIDLSTRAAEELGMSQQGLARVRVEVLPEQTASSAMD